MTTVSYENEGVAERRAQKAPRRWIGNAERESQLTAWPACGRPPRFVVV